MGANSGQKVITLTLNEVKSATVNSPSVTVSPHKEITPSKSSPQLKGAWGERTVFVPVTTLDTKGQYRAIGQHLCYKVKSSKSLLLWCPINWHTF